MPLTYYLLPYRTEASLSLHYAQDLLFPFSDCGNTLGMVLIVLTEHLCAFGVLRICC